MPIFEYRCGRCGELFEELVSSSAAEVTCPGCGSAVVEKQISSFSSHSGPRSLSGGGGCAPSGGG